MLSKHERIPSCTSSRDGVYKTCMFSTTMCTMQKGGTDRNMSVRHLLEPAGHVSSTVHASISAQSSSSLFSLSVSSISFGISSCG